MSCPGWTFAPHTASSASFAVPPSICPTRAPPYRDENGPVRLNAFLARAGIASRRQADELISAGRVLVNGEAGQLNTGVGSLDVVEGGGRRVRSKWLPYVV